MIELTFFLILILFLIAGAILRVELWGKKSNTKIAVLVETSCVASDDIITLREGEYEIIEDTPVSEFAEWDEQFKAVNKTSYIGYDGHPYLRGTCACGNCGRKVYCT